MTRAGRSLASLGLCMPLLCHHGQGCLRRVPREKLCKGAANRAGAELWKLLTRQRSAKAEAWRDQGGFTVPWSLERAAPRWGRHQGPQRGREEAGATCSWGAGRHPHLCPLSQLPRCSHWPAAWKPEDKGISMKSPPGDQGPPRPGTRQRERRGEGKQDHRASP